MSATRIGILEAGRLPPEIEDTHGTYPRMFESLLSVDNAGFDFQTYAAVDNTLPASTDECDAWLVTGSRFGAYDDEPFIPKLKDFLARAFADHVPIVGICFGHQILAEALGGRVVKSSKGWGVGVHDYRVTKTAPWMIGARGSFSIYAMHQDQIETLPDGAEVLAGSDFCPYGVLVYGDTAISFQGHPEYGSQFGREFVKMRLETTIPPAFAEDALASLSKPQDSGMVARWIVNFLKNATKT